MGSIADIIEANQLSRTWKERHAKGTQVKMTIDEFKECTWYGYNYPIVRHFNNGNPEARLEDHGEVYATFCNFRYKQSWLDKK